jgi:glutamine synthetase
MVNVVLCSIFAESFAMMSDAIEGGAKPADVAKSMLDSNWQVIFNGNGYDPAWVEEAGKRGIWRIDSGVEAMSTLSSAKNIKLFSDLKVLSEKEAVARTAVMHEHYAGSVEMEALTMIDMINQHVLPSAKAANMSTAALEAACQQVSKGVAGLHGATDEKEKATLARVLRLETMEEARKVCDTIEETVPANLWTLATYKELLFFDSNQGA